MEIKEIDITELMLSQWEKEATPGIPENVKESLFLSVVPVKEAMEKGWVFEKKNRLALVPRIFVSMDDSGMTAIPITEQVLEIWGASENEVLTRAKVKGQELFPPYIFPFDHMTVVTATRMGYVSAFGAAALFYPGMLEEMERRLGEYYILPSSKTEFILVPADPEIDLRSCREIVRNINADRELMEPDEKLGDFILLCSRGKLFEFIA